MNWIAAGKDAFKTEDDRYSVARVTYVNAQGPYPQWEAWRRRAHPDGAGRIGAWISQEEARKACEEAKCSR
jgi:hypothetical protein